MSGLPLVSLYCFPHAGAGASFFLRLARFVPSFIEIVPVELPGHGRRGNEPLETSMTGLVANLRSRLHHDPKRAYALLGHSLGALTAFEYARQLQADHFLEPLLLFASSSHAPSFRRDERPPALSDSELRTQLRDLAGTPEHALQSGELMEWVLPVLRADLQVAHGYFRGKEHSLNCPIHALAGETDTVDGHAIAAWRDHTRSEFSATLFPGNHFYLHGCMPELGALIANRLTKHLCHATPSYAAAGC